MYLRALFTVGDNEKAERKGHQQGEGSNLCVWMYVYACETWKEWFPSHGLLAEIVLRTYVPRRPSGNTVER